MGFFDNISNFIKNLTTSGSSGPKKDTGRRGGSSVHKATGPRADYRIPDWSKGYNTNTNKAKQPAAKPTVKPTLSIPKSVSVPKIADVRAPAGKASFGSLPSFPRIQSLSPEKMTTVRAPAWSKMAEEKEKEKPADSEEYIEAKAVDQALTDWLTSDGRTGYDELVLDGTQESINNFYDTIQTSPHGEWDLFMRDPANRGELPFLKDGGKGTVFEQLGLNGVGTGNFALDKAIDPNGKKTKEKLESDRKMEGWNKGSKDRYGDWMDDVMADEVNWIRSPEDLNRIAGDLKAAGINDAGVAGLFADWSPLAAAELMGQEMTPEDLYALSNASRLGILGDFMNDGANKGIFGNNLGALSHYLSPIMAGQIGSDYFLPGKTEGVTGIGTAGGKWSGAGQGIDSEQFRRYARSSDLNFSYDDLKDMLEREYNANIYDIIGPSQLAGYGGNLDAIGDEAVRARIEESLRAARDSGRKGKGKK